MTIAFTERASSNDIAVAFYLGNAPKKEEIYAKLAFMLLNVFCLLGYVGYFSILKFRRVAQERREFAAIKESIKGITTE